MLLSYKRSQTSVVLRVKLLSSAVTTGAGLTGLAYDSAGLIISTIADNEATATAYVQDFGTIETIATLGTYAAPTATKCRFKEVDSTNHPGVYEIQIADARFAVASAKSLIVSISGAADCAETDVLIPLVDLDPYAAMRGTDSAALATVCTETRLAELDAANLPADVDAILADTEEIKTKTGMINAGQVTISNGVADNNDLTIYAGDDYNDSAGTHDALLWTIEDYTGVSLAAATVTLRIIAKDSFESGSTLVAALAKVCTVSDTGSGTRDVTIKAELTAAQTATLSTVTPPAKSDAYYYQIDAIAGTKTGLLITGDVTVVPKLTTAV